jgi:DNA gyrase subunit A
VGRGSIGVIGIRFKKKDDEVVGGEIFLPDEKEKSLFTATSSGFGKRTMIYRYRRQHRGGKGIIDIQTGGRNGHVVGIKSVTPGDEIILITKAGVVIRMNVDDARAVGRNTAGVKLINLSAGDTIMDMALVPKEDEEV